MPTFRLSPAERVLGQEAARNPEDLVANLAAWVMALAEVAVEPDSVDWPTAPVRVIQREAIRSGRAASYRIFSDREHEDPGGRHLSVTRPDQDVTYCAELPLDDSGGLGADDRAKAAEVVSAASSIWQEPMDLLTDYNDLTLTARRPLQGTGGELNCSVNLHESELRTQYTVAASVGREGFQVVWDDVKPGVAQAGPRRIECFAAGGYDGTLVDLLASAGVELPAQ